MRIGGRPPPSARNGGSSDAAWKVLDLVAGWIKYADAKAGASLTGAGAVGALLIAQSDKKDASGGSYWAVGFASGSGVALFGASLFALLVLAPRVKSATGTSLIYFDHISANHRARPDRYVVELQRAANNAKTLTDEIGRQIVSNSSVAKIKFYATGWSVRFLIIGTWLAAAAWICSRIGG